MDPTVNSNDHDIIVGLNARFETEMKHVKETLNKIEGNTGKWIELLEKKADQTDFTQTRNDHELRLRRLEIWGAMGIGGLFIVQMVFQFLLK